MRFRRNKADVSILNTLLTHRGLLQSQLTALRLSTGEQDKLIAKLSYQLVSIQRTIGWRLLERLRRLRDRLLPPDSRRLKAYWAWRRGLEIVLAEGLAVCCRKMIYEIQAAWHGHGTLLVEPPQDLPRDLNAPYQLWHQRHPLPVAAVGAIRISMRTFAYTPLISILTPVYDPDEIWLRKAIESVQAQIYPHWELCLVNDASTRPYLRPLLDTYAASDPRLRVKHLGSNEGHRRSLQTRAAPVYRRIRRNCSAVTGACMMVPRRVFEEVKGFDEQLRVAFNGSTDLSVQLVRERFPEVRIIELAENRGFAGGNIEGFKACTGDCIALINHDTHADERWLENLLQPMIDDSRLGTCASKLIMSGTRSINSAGDGLTVAGVGFNRGLWRDQSRYNDPELVFGGCGAAVLYRREMLEEVGFLDEDFFLYDEDDDLNFRAQLAGWKCLYVPSAIVSHQVSATTGRRSDLHVYYHSLIWG